MIELYCAWTIVNLIWLLVNIYISNKSEKMLNEANEILDQDEKLNEEMKNTIADWEERIEIHEEVEKLNKEWENFL